MEGLSDILRSVSETKTRISKQHPPLEIKLHLLSASKFQPRKDFDADEIDNLAASIKEVGLINPITIRKTADDKYEIIAGERRWRAVQQLGWETIPVIVKEIADRDAYAMALVENLQRENLNPIEEADGYMQLVENYSLTHEQVAEYVGKPRSTISNYIRLLDLHQPVRDLLKNNLIDVGHAKLLVSLSSNVQIELAEKVSGRNLSVRQLEVLIKKTVLPSKATKPARTIDDRYKDIATYLKRKTGVDFEVSVSSSAKNKLTFANEESLEKFMELLS